jgi:hypothetical protein
LNHVFRGKNNTFPFAPKSTTFCHIRFTLSEFFNKNSAKKVFFSLKTVWRYIFLCCADGNRGGYMGTVKDGKTAGYKDARIVIYENDTFKFVE